MASRKNRLSAKERYRGMILDYFANPKKDPWITKREVARKVCKLRNHTDLWKHFTGEELDEVISEGFSQRRYAPGVERQTEAIQWKLFELCLAGDVAAIKEWRSWMGVGAPMRVDLSGKVEHSHEHQSPLDMFFSQLLEEQQKGGGIDEQ